MPQTRVSVLTSYTPCQTLFALGFSAFWARWKLDANFFATLLPQSIQANPVWARWKLEANFPQLFVLINCREPSHKIQAVSDVPPTPNTRFFQGYLGKTWFSKVKLLFLVEHTLKKVGIGQKGFKVCWAPARSLRSPSPRPYRSPRSPQCRSLSSDGRGVAPRLSSTVPLEKSSTDPAGAW